MPQLALTDAIPAAERPPRPRPAPAVALSGVHKSFTAGDQCIRVLNGCTFEVRQGECVYLLGPSGSGKSTLLSIIGCVLRPDDGRVQIQGVDVRRLSSRGMAKFRRTQIGFVFQRFHLIRGLSALENVCVPLTLAGAPRRVAERRGRELLGIVGLAEHAGRQPRQLSMGQCQRVAFARALAADPPLILADEPTASLDADSGQQAMQILRRLTVEAGKSAVIVTHDSRILPFADRILVLDRGQLDEEAPQPPPRRGPERQSRVVETLPLAAHGDGFC